MNGFGGEDLDGSERGDGLVDSGVEIVSEPNILLKYYFLLEFDAVFLEAELEQSEAHQHNKFALAQKVETRGYHDGGCLDV